jgi:hypothetical protein
VYGRHLPDAKDRDRPIADLEHHARVIGRAARDRRHGTVETKVCNVQLVDEGVYDSDRVVLSDVVIDAFGE